MDQPASRLGAGATAKAVLAITGLLGGLLVGAAWSAITRPGELEAVGIVVKDGVVGSFLGMGAAIVAAPGLRNSLTTVRGLAWMVGATAIVLLLWRALP
jgi:hypothetical protein